MNANLSAKLIANLPPFDPTWSTAVHRPMS